MRSRIAVSIAGALLAVGLAACGGGSDSAEADQTLTYWASNQGTSLQHDEEVLRPELDKFEEETGTQVELEVIDWADLLNRILAATTSGEGPDVLNIGNTWSASLQATGAFLPFEGETLDTVGGADKFLEPSFAATGAEGEPPTSVPLYGYAYALFYNKAMFEEAGIAEPPSTWAEFDQVAQQLTQPPDQWGLAMEGASYTESVHFAFILGQQQGADYFNDQGEPQFATPEAVAAVKQYVDFMGEDGIVNPSNAEYDHASDMAADFAAGKAAMMIVQNNARAALADQGMSEDDYGVAPVPLPDPLPPGGDEVTSFVAGINLSVFNNTDNREGALELVNFLTSPEEQRILNEQYGSLPVVHAAYEEAAFQTPVIETLRQILATTAEPLPQIPEESQFETLVGNTVNELIARTASGDAPTEADIEAALSEANQQMLSGG